MILLATNGIAKGSVLYFANVITVKYLMSPNYIFVERNWSIVH
jgi:hypothetical protein